MRRHIIKPAELVFAYAFLGLLPALYLCIWALFLTALFGNFPSSISPTAFAFLGPAVGLAGCVSGTLVLFGVGTTSGTARGANVFCLLLGVSAGLRLAWFSRELDLPMALLALSPALVGLALIGHLLHAAQRRRSP
jgi:hypothetical protein